MFERFILEDNTIIDKIKNKKYSCDNDNDLILFIDEINELNHSSQEYEDNVSNILLEYYSESIENEDISASIYLQKVIDDLGLELNYEIISGNDCYSRCHDSSEIDFLLRNILIKLENSDSINEGLEKVIYDLEEYRG